MLLVGFLAAARHRRIALHLLRQRLQLAALAADGSACRGLRVFLLQRLDRTHERLADGRRGGRLRAAQREEQCVRELERRQQVLGLEAVARKEGEQLLLQRRYVGQQAGGGGAWLGSRLGLGLGLGLGVVARGWGWSSTCTPSPLAPSPLEKETLRELLRE